MKTKKKQVRKPKIANKISRLDKQQKRFTIEKRIPNSRTSKIRAGNNCMFYSIQAAAKELKIWQKTLDYRIKTGKIKGTKINGRIFVSEFTIARLKGEKAIRVCKAGEPGSNAVTFCRAENLKRLMEVFRSGTFEICELPPETPEAREIWIFESGEIDATIAQNAIRLVGVIAGKRVKGTITPEFYGRFVEGFQAATDKDQFVSDWIASVNPSLLKV